MVEHAGHLGHSLCRVLGEREQKDKLLAKVTKEVKSKAKTRI
jgi:hypothetical protein